MLKLIDFRCVPNFTQVNKTIAQKPYFKDFMNALQRQSQPTINELSIWLWIYRSKEAKIQVSTFIHKCLRMCTKLSMRTIGRKVMRGWKITQPITSWHEAQCTSSFSSRSCTKCQGRIQSPSQKRLQLRKHQCIPSLVSITSLSTGSPIRSFEWNSTYKFLKCSTSPATSSYPSLAAGKYYVQGW